MKTKLIRFGELPRYSDSETGYRGNWDQAFEKMADQEDDQLLDKSDTEQPISWDESDWTW